MHGITNCFNPSYLLWKTDVLYLRKRQLEYSLYGNCMHTSRVLAVTLAYGGLGPTSYTTIWQWCLSQCLYTVYTTAAGNTFIEIEIQMKNDCQISRFQYMELELYCQTQCKTRCKVTSQGWGAFGWIEFCNCVIGMKTAVFSPWWPKPW